MSTLAMPPKRVRLYRALWDRWIIILRIMFDLGAGAHPVKWRHVADTLLIDKKTCQKYINGLVRDGRLAVAGEGFMLTETGMSMLSETNEGEIPPLEGKNLGEKFSPLKESVVVVNDSELSLTTTPSKLGKNPGEKISPEPEIFSEDVRQALEQVPLLFDGGEITQKGLPTFLHIEKVMGWIAYVYDRRADIHSPCGLLYSKLKDPTSPSPSIKYMKNPYQFLPEDYLNVIGRFEKTCTRCETVFTDLGEYEQHRESCTYTHTPEVEVEQLAGPDETVTPEVSAAWKKVLDYLQQDMPKASFETWVHDTTPMHYQGDELQVSARNTYARDWLADRMTAQASALLAGAMGRPMRVKFIVATETLEA